MAANTTQSYDNHAHRPVLAAVAFAATLTAAGFFLAELMRFRGPLMYGIAALTVAVMCLTLISRVYIVRLQDRIIRLEMQVRLARLGLESALPRLGIKQIVALRFASDAELPALVERAIAERLTNDQIKRAVREWQPDRLRT